ncbi:MAG: twin-arginine translocation signal domain-containing protein [Geminicoccaceae bacterium]
MEHERQEAQAVSRRGFMRLAGQGAGVAGVGAISLATPDAAKADEAPQPGRGYRETDHVRSYYELARM